MFNWNSNGGDGSEVPDSGSLWMQMAGKVLGVQHVIDAIRDPRMIAQAMQMMQAMIESQMANARIEAKLDLVLRERGIDVDAINRAVAERFGRSGPVIDGAVVSGTAGGPSTIVPEQHRTAGNRPAAAAGRTADHGSEAPARHHRRTNGGH